MVGGSNDHVQNFNVSIFKDSRMLIRLLKNCSNKIESLTIGNARF